MSAADIRALWKSLWLDILKAKRENAFAVSCFRAAARGDATATEALLDLARELFEGANAELLGWNAGQIKRDSFNFHMNEEPVIEGLVDAVADFDR
jgi:hypothetical protein